MLASIQVTRLNQRDAEQLDRGYYEGLLGTRTVAFALQRRQRPPSDWQSAEEAGAYLFPGGLLQYELRPSWEGLVKRAPFKTNEWGMADRYYPHEKADSVFRIAVIGASYEMGAGVLQDEVYHALLEERLNEMATSGRYKRYEVLNFAVGGYSYVNNIANVRQKVAPFDPDVVLYMVYSTEKSRLNTRLYRTVTEQAQVEDPFLRSILNKSGVTATIERSEFLRRLEPFVEEVNRWALTEIAANCEQMGVTPLFVLTRTTEEGSGIEPSEKSRVLELATNAGFITLDLDGLFRDEQVESIRLAPWDNHPNVKGHELISDRLFEELLENSVHLELGLTLSEDNITEAEVATMQPALGTQ